MLITCHATHNKNMVAQEVAPIAQGYWTALLLHPFAGLWDTCKEGASQLMWQCGFEFLLSDILVVFFFSMCSIAASSNHSFVLFKSPLHQPPSNRCLDQIQAPMPYVGCPQFVVGSRLCSERFFFGYSGFPIPTRNGRQRITMWMGYH